VTSGVTGLNDAAAPPGMARFDARLLAEATALGALAARMRPVGRRPREGAIGVNGRRRAGPGTAFWQYRAYAFGESARQIDWRRSARGDLPIVREREWEAALTLDLWVDSSRSMQYPPAGGPAAKRRVADLLALAAASAWFKNGERIRVLGDPKAQAVTRMGSLAAALARTAAAQRNDEEAGLPPRARPPAQGFVLLVGDFLSEPLALLERATALARAGARGAAIQVLHGDEATLDFGGRVEFQSLEGEESHLLRQVESGREKYLKRLDRHQETLADGLGRVGWPLLQHRSDRPHGPVLFAALAALAEGD